MSNEYGGYIKGKWHRCICPKFVTDLFDINTKFNNKDPCGLCGHRLIDHPEYEKKIKELVKTAEQHIGI